MNRILAAILLVVIGLLGGYYIAVARIPIISVILGSPKPIMSTAPTGMPQPAASTTPKPTVSALISAHIFTVAPLPFPTSSNGTSTNGIVFDLPTMDASANGQKCKADGGILSLTPANAPAEVAYAFKKDTSHIDRALTVAVIFLSKPPTHGNAGITASYLSNTAYTGVPNAEDAIITLTADSSYSGHATLTKQLSSSVAGGVIIVGCPK